MLTAYTNVGQQAEKYIMHHGRICDVRVDHGHETHVSILLSLVANELAKLEVEVRLIKRNYRLLT